MEKYIDNYIEYLRNERKRTENTIMAYKRDLLLFNDYLITKNSLSAFRMREVLHKLSTGI
jgi:site-specific recombinase XerD